MDRLIKPDIQTLNLLFTKNQQNCSKTFKLTNLMHTMSVAVSLTSSNPSLFTFSKPYSILPPLSTTSFTISLTNPSNQPPLSTPAATVLVKSSILPTGKARQEDLRRLFSRPGPHIFKDANIPIFFVGSHVAEFLLSSSLNFLDFNLLFPKSISVCDMSQLNYLLRIVVTKGKSEFISPLIRAGADVNYRELNEESESLMSLAVKSGKIESIQILTESGFESNNKSDRFFHDAAALNQVDLIETLCLAFPDMDLDSLNSQGQTSLHIAAIHNHVESIEFLVSLGCDPDVADNAKWTPLHYASNEGHLEAVKSLLNHSTFAKYAINNEGRTAFALALEKGYSDLYDLLQLGDPLHRAARIDDANGLKFFLAQGANVNGKDQNGWTPLHRAAFKGNMECVKVLVCNGATIDVVDGTGFTPLLRAVEAGHVQVGMYLLSHGAKASLKSLKGVLPFDLEGLSLKNNSPPLMSSLHQQKLESF